MKIKKTNSKILSFVLFLALLIVTVHAMPVEIRAAEKSFSSTGSSSVVVRSTKKQYIKFKSGVTGYVTLKIQNLSESTFADAEVTFCDGNKNALGQSKEYLTTDAQTARRCESSLAKYGITFKKANCYTRTYGVRKNTTYYFAVKSAKAIKVTLTVKAVSKGANTTKNNALEIKQNKKVEGILIAGDKKADWYKIRLKTAGKIQLDYTAKTNGSIMLPDNRFGIKVSFYQSDGSYFYVNGDDKSEDYVSDVVPSSWCRFYKVNADGDKIDLDTGTYYVKVERLTKKSSGQYALKWMVY